MKQATTITILLLSLTCFNISAQKTKQFRENLFLVLDTNRKNAPNTYASLKRDTTIVLMLDSGKKKMDYIDSIYDSRGRLLSHKRVWKDLKEKDDTVFILERFSIPSTHKKFYGDIKQEKNILKFYPWKFPEKQPKFPCFSKSVDVIGNKAMNKKLKGKKFYLKIPDRKVVRIKYRAYQFGALTLPLKVYAKKIPQVAKAQFDANLNLLLGRTWGRKKYAYYANEAKTPWTNSRSINFILGISSVELGKENTDGKFEDELDEAVLNYGIALGWQYKSIGFFVAAGIDSPLSERGNSWVYEDTPWIGFGLGLGL